jgi:hypothetical protein
VSAGNISTGAGRNAPLDFVLVSIEKEPSIQQVIEAGFGFCRVSARDY